MYLEQGGEDDMGSFAYFDEAAHACTVTRLQTCNHSSESSQKDVTSVHAIKKIRRAGQGEVMGSNADLPQSLGWWRAQQQ